MSKTKHDRWTETYARQVLTRAEQHNMRDSALARELGVSQQRISRWRKRLKGAPTATQPAFVEIKLAAAKPTAQPFAIRTNKGRAIEVWPGFDAAELARLIAVVEKEPC